MLSIGEFSKICGVTTKTLRYYAEIGLMNPDEIHPENGYRYYSIKQLKKMLFINRLKSYHFSLDEIKAILEMEDDQSEEKLVSALLRKQREMYEKRNALDYTIKQLNHDLLKMEQGIPMMAYLDNIEVQLVETQPIHILSLRQMLTSDDYAKGYGKYFSKLYERVATEKLNLLGTPMTIYHSPEYNPAGNDTEFALPVAEAVMGTRDLPGDFVQNLYVRGLTPN